MNYLEVRDAMKAGKTTALIMAGSTEQNGPYMAGGKHQYAMKLIGEGIARKLGNALIAPLIPMEAGNPENKYLEWGSIYFTAETFQAGVPAVLFRVPLMTGQYLGYRWAPTADGQRFYVLTALSGSRAPRITVVTNWTAELKKR